MVASDCLCGDGSPLGCKNYNPFSSLALDDFSFWPVFNFTSATTSSTNVTLKTQREQFQRLCSLHSRLFHAVVVVVRRQEQKTQTVKALYVHEGRIAKVHQLEKQLDGKAKFCFHGRTRGIRIQMILVLWDLSSSMTPQPQHLLLLLGQV